MENLYKPTARSGNLVVQQVADETLVYNMSAHRAFCLNPTAAFVWQECSGCATVNEIADKLSTDSAVEDLVWLAVEQLARFDLIENAPPRQLDRNARRHAIKALLLSTLIMIPTVSTIATPRDNRSSLSVCVCTGNGECALPGCPSPPNCGPAGICI